MRILSHKQIPSPQGGFFIFKIALVLSHGIHLEISIGNGGRDNFSHAPALVIAKRGKIHYYL